MSIFSAKSLIWISQIHFFWEISYSHLVFLQVFFKDFWNVYLTKRNCGKEINDYLLWDFCVIILTISCFIVTSDEKEISNHVLIYSIFTITYTISSDCISIFLSLYSVMISWRRKRSISEYIELYETRWIRTIIEWNLLTKIFWIFSTAFQQQLFLFFLFFIGFVQENFMFVSSYIAIPQL
jgi:hypothetical protein